MIAFCVCSSSMSEFYDVETVMIDHTELGRTVVIRRKWDNPQEELDYMKKEYSLENDPINKIKMYAGIMLSNPRRRRTAWDEVMNPQHEYIRSEQLGNLMDAVYSAMPTHPRVEKLATLAGLLKPSVEHGPQWMQAEKGFKKRFADALQTL